MQRLNVLLCALALSLSARLPAVTVAISLSPSAGVGSIPPVVYGSNHFDVQGAVPLRRFGGNRVTGYNWENNCSNAGTDYLNNSDYYLLGQVGLPQNAAQAPAAVPVNYVKEFRALGSQAEIVSIQAAGYVAADAAGPVTAGQAAPSSRWVAIQPHKPGWPASLTLAPNTSDGVVYMDEQVNYLVNQFGPASAGGIKYYAIDNEPALWPSTHPYLHPAAPTYAEMIARSTGTAQAILDIDPSAQIMGCVAYGWGEYTSLQSASDSGTYDPTYDWYLGYYLAQMQAASAVAGRRLLHYLDLHWYPEATGFNGSTDVRIDQGGDDVSQGVAVARMQAPRSLWDPSYTEASWITSGSTPWSPVWPGSSAPIQLIPRLKHYVAKYYPGTGISFSEYDYGAPYDVSGGIAEADVLGILGKYGVPACRWGYSSVTSYAQAAYDLYLDYDGAGSKFGDLSFSAQTSDGSETSVYAAKRSADPELLTVLLLNKDYSNPVTATVSVALMAGQSIESISVRRFDPSGSALYSPPAPAIAGGGFTDVPPARSASLYVIRLISAGSPTSTISPSPTVSPSGTVSPSATVTPSATPSPSPTASPSISPTDTASPTASPSPSASPSFTASPTVTPTPLPTYACPRVVMGFYTYYSGLDPSLVPWAQLSHVAHAFLGLGSDGSLTPPSGYLNPALNAAAHAHGVKILASIGGAGSGATYSAMSADPAARAAFVNNAYAFLLANAYDGVDLDYEFPSNATDRANLNLLVQALRARFNAGGQAWLITGDLNWGSYYGQWWDVATLKSSMDWFNLMEYDMFGSWSGYSGHNAPLNDSTLPGGAAFSGTNGSASVAYYLGRGVPPQQLVYGIAAYGYRYDTAALYQACAAGDCSSANNWPYSAVAAAIGSGWTRSWDASASSPYLTSSNGLQVISYDDPQSVLAKAQAMVWTHNLGGTFVWELSQDLVGSTHPLVAAMATAGYCAPYTPTLTPTVTPSITPNGTFTATPTGSPSATVSPTPSISRTPANGPLAIGAVAPVPQPNPRWLDVQMLGPADELTVKVYSANLALVRPPLRLKALGQGWDLVELSPLTVGLPNGIYFVWAQARRGGQSSPVARARLVVLK